MHYTDRFQLEEFDKFQNIIFIINHHVPYKIILSYKRDINFESCDLVRNVESFQWKALTRHSKSTHHGP
jgi:hypothetical protein